ncbi:MAG: hypothetical protein JNM13_15270 [Hyphomicrobiaceae bacterium]|nr:hypothetical protein [Hyphomicrobiaceae bacterium]
MTIGSPIYQRQIAPLPADHVMRRVWDDTPWIVDALTCLSDDQDESVAREIRAWCVAQFGPEAWPLRDHPGEWHVGCATVYGWTWIGFRTEAMMTAFRAAWTSCLDGRGEPTR